MGQMRLDMFDGEVHQSVVVTCQLCKSANTHLVELYDSLQVDIYMCGDCGHTFAYVKDSE